MSKESFRNMAASDVEVAEVPVFNTGQKARRGALTEGAKIQFPVSGGRSVAVVLKRIPGERVEKQTMVWGLNERDQALLTEAAIADILDSVIDGGQRIPAVGREENGVLMVADGSRRRMATILAGEDFYCWVGAFSDDDMNDLTEIGNYHKPTSEWEKARRIEWRVKTEFGGNQSAAEKALGISRRSIARALRVAQVPREVVACFACPNDMSGRKAVRIIDAWESANKKKRELLIEQCGIGLYIPQAEGDEHAELITQRIESILSPSKKDQAEKSDGHTRPTPSKSTQKMAFNAKKGTANIKLEQLPPAVLKRIEDAVNAELSRHYESGWFELPADSNAATQARITELVDTIKRIKDHATIELTQEQWFDIQKQTFDAAMVVDMSAAAIERTMQSAMDELTQTNDSPGEQQLTLD